MNRQDVIRLLTYAAACDARTVAEEDLYAWYDILAPLDFSDCLAAARKHYRAAPDVRLKPGHLWQLAHKSTGPTAVDACEQGILCDDCKLVHRPDEPCDVNTQRPEAFLVALESVRGIDSDWRPTHSDPRDEGPELAASEPSPLANPNPVPVGMVLRRCHCGGVFRADADDGITAHETVYGHRPIVAAEPAAEPSIETSGAR